MKRPVYVIIGILVMIIGLAVAQVSVANQISTTGAELSSLQAKIDTYKRENISLQEDLLSVSSYTNLAEQAEEHGYTESKAVISLSNSAPLARR